MTFQHTLLSLCSFSGIPHQNYYYYNKTVMVQGPLLRLKIIKNITGNM